MQALKTMNITNYFTESEIDRAFETAKKKQLPVLVDFWAPGCKGCKKMDDTTYQTSIALEYVDKHFVFVKYNITNRDAQKLHVSPVLWTPCFMVISNDGSEVRKTIGYLTPTQFQDELELGRAMAHLRKAQSAEALRLLENFITATDNQLLQQEALYWAGVASYFLHKRNPESLVPHWETLMNRHPDGIWAERANCLNVAS